MRRPVNRGARVTVQSIPPSVGGLNTLDAVANMPATDAVILDNYFPGTADVPIRQGYQLWGSGITGNVETLASFTSGTQKKLFAVAGGSIYDVTSNAAVGAPLITGLSNSRWQWVNFSNAGATFLVMVNGIDAPLLYNGTTWQSITQTSTPIAITGVNPSTFAHVGVSASRLWFAQATSMQAWYLPVGQVGGAATLFDIGPQTTRGGFLMGVATWNIDNSAGLNPYTIFVTSEGEVAAYLGSDPSQSSSFSIAARFRIGNPVGRRFFEKVGSELVFICADGLLPLSKALLTDRAEADIALTEKIRPSVNADYAVYKGNFGWQPILYPDGTKLIINVPTQEDSTSHQYVMNTITKSWCRFTGWNAFCFVYFNSALYMGGANFVAQADIGNDDGGMAINTDIKPAFNYFGMRGQEKFFKMMRPVFIANSAFAPQIDLSVDFSNATPTSTPTFSQGSATPWDTTPWDRVPWNGAQIVQTDWESIDGIGYAATYRMRAQTKGVQFAIESVDFMFEPKQTPTL
ncbi:hypothetical protein WT15_27430 [Burkholderia stagnalis]|uniref:hypothetical protein n=1 Tax=Burkholderia stagnalis TaxID=1503054 RepID=UPI00075543B4|nr:hypothetical protein [Burkholderia stagnalis]KVN72810.1 hypothetical protein WT15_27430 [Burkholderia stagnalis]KWO38190.1 hypothetical protein WT96_12795 [Burkholderia stagnalis]KWO41088.1 hypothetical protein WT95_03050 [Burkholderia stagnalis]